MAPRVGTGPHCGKYFAVAETEVQARGRKVRSVWVSVGRHMVSGSIFRMTKYRKEVETLGPSALIAYGRTDCKRGSSFFIGLAGVAINDALSCCPLGKVTDP